MSFIEEIKRQKNIGRCLHYDSGRRCNEIINSHSIQRKHLADDVAENGHAYRINADYRTLENNNDRVGITKIGIRKKLSTFLGFCKTHDNEIFECIDNQPLSPTDKQVMLYSYRSLCREYFVKENALNVCTEYLTKNAVEKATKEFITTYMIGIKNGFNSLKFHKQKYDNSLKAKDYDDIEYVSFFSKEKPIIYFSGNIFPDFDFTGNILQDLGTTETYFQLITFFSAPTAGGWAYVFAWHKSSTEICKRYLQSLATCIHLNESCGDILFRHLISCCENHAISPIWWEKLSDKHKQEILNRVQLMVHPVVPLFPNYLNSGLEGIANWHFPEVQCNY